MSQFQQSMVDEQANAGMVVPEAENRKPSAGGYRTLAVIAFVLAVGGLFIGLLYALSGVFLGNFRGEDFLADSLLGFGYTYFKTMFADLGGFFNTLFTGGSMIDVFTFLLVVLLCVSVVLSLVLMIVSFCTAKGAKNCAMTSAIFVFLSYAGFFLLSYYSYSFDNGAFGGGMVDVTTGIVAGVMLICLIITALARRKGLGLLNVLSFLLVAAVIFGLTYPGSAMAEADIWYTHFGNNLFVNLTAFIAAVVVILNFIISVVRMSAKKAYVFDAVRFGILLVAVVLAIVAQIVDKTFEVMFGSANLLAVILAAAASLAAFLLALIIAIVQASKARAKEAEEASAEIGAENTPYAFAQPAPLPAPAAAAPAAAAQPAAVQQPEPASAPAAESAEPAAAQQTVSPAPGTTVIVQQPAATQPATPIYAVPFFAAPMAPAQQPAAAQPEQPAPAPAEEPKPAAPAEDTPMSEFERSMAALARGIAPEPAPYQAPAYSQPVAAPKAVYDPTPYTYDSFINMLTPQEKNEFGDLFIANRYGDLNYLPAYVIGGDNREFFRKVFIYLGKFRNHISPELLGKLYDYVSKQ